MRDLVSPGLSPALSVQFGLVEDAFRRLTRRVADLGPAELHYRGADGGNSTAMLLRHTLEVDRAYLFQITGLPVFEVAVDPQHGPGVDANNRIPEVVDFDLAALLAEYETVLAAAKAYFKDKTDDELTREVQVPWWPEPGTVRYVLWHMASHSSLHQGHIARLKAAYRKQA